MELFLSVLHKFPGEPAIETKVLGLLNNIAEVPGLRQHLMVVPFIDILRFVYPRAVLRIRIRIWIRKDPKSFAGSGYGSETGDAPYQKSSIFSLKSML
jgi:hypothetical protein